MPLSIEHRGADRSHGYQFLFFVLPVARVFPDHLSDLVADKLTTYAGFGKVGLLRGVDAPAPSTGISVLIESVSVNGYDILVTRRPTASISLRGQLYQRGVIRRDCRATGSFSEFARFAFAEDLQRSLEQAVDAAARDLLECMGIFSPQDFQRVHGIDLR
jgi:hypothetical protein